MSWEKVFPNYKISFYFFNEWKNRTNNVENIPLVWDNG